MHPRSANRLSGLEKRSLRERLSSFDRKRIFRLCGPVDWRISFPANLSSPSDVSSQTCGQGRRTIFLPAGAYSPSPACLHLYGLAFGKQKKNTHPRGRKAWNKGERDQFEIMEDAMTIVLIIVLCLLLKALIAAILRGFGSSEHRRDR